jgi:hypothetical protein
MEMSNFFWEYIFPAIICYIGFKLRPKVYKQYSSKLRGREWAMILTPIVNFLMAFFIMALTILFTFGAILKFLFEGNQK